MSGDLFFGIRQNNSGNDFVEIFNATVAANGIISEVVTLPVDLAVPAGEIELALIFYPDTIDTTDQLDTSGNDWRLKGIISFDIQAESQQRGNPSVVIIRVTDHMGMNTNINFSGNYDFEFNSYLYFIEKKGALWFTLAGIFIVILAIVLYIIFK